MQWFEWVSSGEAWVALGTLTALEIILGIDNIIFISILTGRLPQEERPRARRVGLMLALGMRIALLMTLSWIMSLTQPCFTILELEISGRDLILLGGGLFLIGKSTVEIHHKLEGDTAEAEQELRNSATSFRSVIVQIGLLDLVFSFDSVITAVGMAKHLPVMILAVIISVIVMMISVNAICDFVERHPTFKVLALSFLILIGVSLIGEGLELHIPKGYVYFAMAFSFVIELLNMRMRSTGSVAVRLRGPRLDEEGLEDEHGTRL